jgi:hypothetical protein
MKNIIIQIHPIDSTATEIEGESELMRNPTSQQKKTSFALMSSPASRRTFKYPKSPALAQ